MHLMYLIFFHGVSTLLAMDIWSSISKCRRETHHEGHEDHEETTEYKNAFVLFVSFVVKVF